MDANLSWIVMVSTFAGLAASHHVCFVGSGYDPQTGIQRWVIPYEDPCECTAIRLAGMTIPAASFRQGALFNQDQLFLSEDSDEIRAHYNCNIFPTVSTGACPKPDLLGMKDGTILDEQITASSFFAANRPPAGRLDNTNFWRPKGANENSWFEVDLVRSTVVTGTITQGSNGFYTTQYTVGYLPASSTVYEQVRDGLGNIKMFVGNTDDFTQVTNQFDESVMAVKVRVEPTGWGGSGVALRLELLGCRLE